MIYYRLFKMYRKHGSSVFNAIRRAWEMRKYV